MQIATMCHAACRFSRGVLQHQVHSLNKIVDATENPVRVSKPGPWSRRRQSPRRDLQTASGPQVHVAPLRGLVHLRTLATFGHDQGLGGPVENVVGLNGSPAVGEPDNLGVSGQCVRVLQQASGRPCATQACQHLFSVAGTRWHISPEKGWCRRVMKAGDSVFPSAVAEREFMERADV